VRIEAVEPRRLVDELGAAVAGVFESAHGYPPGTRTRRFVGEQLVRHAGRPGFRFLAALAEDGSLLGFAYGYTGGAGEWWHDRVAARLGEVEAARWLAPGHLELVELAVRPGSQGVGHGSALHDQLLRGWPGPTAVLSTQRANARALRFYRDRGWVVIVRDMDFGRGFEPYSVLGLEL